MAFGNNNQPRFIMNQRRLQPFERLSRLTQEGVVTIPFTTDRRILLINSRSNWVLPYDLLNREIEFNGNYPNYIGAAARVVETAIGLPHNYLALEQARDLGRVTLPGEMNRRGGREQGLHFVAVPFVREAKFNNLNFSRSDGVEGADLVTVQRAHELISSQNSNITDLLTLIGIMKFIAG